MYRMNRRHHTFHAFAEESLREYLGQRISAITEEIKQLDGDYVLNVNESEYVEHLIGQYTIDVPLIDFDHPHVTVLSPVLSVN